MRRPAWKAENARIRKEMAARKKQTMVCKVVQIPPRTVPLKASWIFDCEVRFLPYEMRKDMARQIIARKLAERLQYEFISMECDRNKRTGAEKWTGTLWAVRGDEHNDAVQVPYCWKCGARMDAGEDE